MTQTSAFFMHSANEQPDITVGSLVSWL